MGSFLYKRKKNTIGCTSLILKKAKVPFRKNDIVYITDDEEILHSRWIVSAESDTNVKIKKEPERTISLDIKNVIDVPNKRISGISEEDSSIIDKYFIHKLNLFPFYDISTEDNELNVILDELRKADDNIEVYVGVNTNRNGLFEKYNMIISKYYGIIIFKTFENDLFEDHSIQNEFLNDIKNDSIYKTLCSSSFLSDDGNTLNINYRRYYIFETEKEERYEMINNQLNNSFVVNKDMFIDILKEISGTKENIQINKDIHFGILQMLIPQYTNSKVENVHTSKLKFMPEQAYELDDIQKEIIANLDKRCYLKAAAGSGKTILLLAKAYEMASSNPDKLFLLICFNSKLAEDIRILSANTGKIRNNLRIETFDKFIELYYSQYEDLNDSDKFEYRRREFVNKINSGHIVNKYGGIFIDEMQQLNEEYIAAFLELLDDNKYMIIAGDYYQQISSAGDDISDDGDDDGEVENDDFYIGDYNFEKITLDKNYRNTEQITRVANKMLKRINEFVDLLHIPYVEEQKSIISGKTGNKGKYSPEYYSVETKEEEITKIIEVIRDLLINKKLTQNDILIMTPWDISRTHKNYIIYKIEEELKKSGIKYCDFSEKGLNEDGIRIGTIGKSIGLDFKAVIICGMNQMKETKDKIKIKTMKDLLDQDVKTKKEFIKYLKHIYVACSRAREILVVIDDFNTNRGSNLISQFLKLVGESNE